MKTTARRIQIAGPTPRLIGHSVVTGEQIASQMRREFIEATITGAKEFTPIYQILERLRQIEQEYQPLLADSFWASDLAAWLPVMVMAGASVWTAGYVQT